MQTFANDTATGVGGVPDAVCDKRTIGVNIDLPGRPCIVPDEVAIGRMAARHLIDMGHRNLVCLSVGQDWARTRCRGFVAEYRSVGFSPLHHDGDIFDVTRRNAAGDWIVGSLHNLLASLPKPAGILVGCDGWGAHVIQ